MVQTVEEFVASVEECEDDWPTNNLMEMISWFAMQASQIPADFVADARCEISTIDRGDMAYATLRISYRRPETAKEIDARLKDEYDRAVRLRERELAELERLAVKYGRA